MGSLAKRLATGASDLNSAPAVDYKGFEVRAHNWDPGRCAVGSQEWDGEICDSMVTTIKPFAPASQPAESVEPRRTKTCHLEPKKEWQRSQ